MDVVDVGSELSRAMPNKSGRERQGMFRRINWSSDACLQFALVHQLNH